MSEETTYPLTLIFLCAVFPYGCDSQVMLQLPPGSPPLPVHRLDDYVRDELPDEVEWQLLERNWHREYGRWVCPKHPETGSG
jgi:hypothetical protein